MPHNKVKSINRWTDKHRAFCLENKLSPCATFLWQWLVEKNDDEPDLKDFNKWVSKHRGKPYCRPHLKAAFNQLVETRVIRLVKQFTWHLVRIVTRAIPDLFPKKNCRHQSKSYAEQPSNLESAKEEVYNSNNYLYSDADKQNILLECAEHGIFFNPKQDIELFSYSPEEITESLNYYSNLPKRSRTRIHNPCGWLLYCLKYSYWEDMEMGLIDYLMFLKENIPTAIQR